MSTETFAFQVYGHKFRSKISGDKDAPGGYPFMAHCDYIACTSDPYFIKNKKPTDHPSIRLQEMSLYPLVKSDMIPELMSSIQAGTQRKFKIEEWKEKEER